MFASAKIFFDKSNSIFCLSLLDLSNLITSNDGTIEDLDRWGIRKLAYPINKFREGNYVSSLVNIDPSKVTTIEGSIRSNEDILRHLLTLKD